MWYRASLLFARPPRPDENTVLCETSQVLLAADEAGEQHGQIVRHIFQRAQGRELGGKILGDELEKMLGPGQIAQPMLAQMPQTQPGR